MMTGLYIHIPFCGSRCPYCDFAFVVGQHRTSERYVDALLKEFRTRTSGMRPAFETVFLGGGTPSEIEPSLLHRILDEVRNRSALSPEAEITAEVNPEDHDRFDQIRKAGVNRLSIGVQALENETLKALGRRHTAEKAEAAYLSARRAGFDSVNIDLIFGAPDQTLDSWQRTLDRACELDPDHLSVYGLTIEDGTAFARRASRNRLPVPPEGDQAAMYEYTLDRLKEAGFIQYEISNFCKPGKACRHNVACWERHEYLGIGLSAHSFQGGCRTWNINDLMAYIEKVEATGTAGDAEEVITESKQQLETIMLGLRRPSGIPEEMAGNTYQLRNLIEGNLVEQSKGRIRLTRPGLLLADLVCAELAKGI